MRNAEQEFSLKSLFVPLTTFKAIHIIVICGFLVFGNMLFNGFVWDDLGFIIDNPEVHVLRIENILGSSVFNDSPYYRPLPALYFTIQYLLFKDVAFFYHLSQLTLHITNAVLLFLFFKEFFKKHLALILSLVFLVHPMQVESVSYISASVSPLFFFFGMLALLLSRTETLSFKRKLLINSFLLLSLFVKEAGVLFIFLIFLYRLLIKKREAKFFFVSGLLIVGVYVLTRFIAGIPVGDAARGLIPIASLPLFERLLHIPSILFYYLKTFFFPIGLSINQLWTITAVDLTSFYLPLALDIGFFVLLGLLGIYMWRKNKSSFSVFLFFALWFACGLVLHLQVLPLNMTVADRWFYFSMVGLLGIFGISIEAIFNTKKIVFVVLIIIVAIFSVRTMDRNTNWVDAITLYTHDSNVRDNYQLENNLGLAYLSLQKYDEAIVHLNKSIEMLPVEITYYNLGYAYDLKGEKKQAEKYYLKSLHFISSLSTSNKPMHAAYIGLGRLYLMENALRSAKDIISQGLGYYPDSEYLWALLAVSEYKANNYQSALANAEKARAMSSTNFTNYIYQQIVNKQPIILR